MLKTENFARQHSDILDIVGEITNHMNVETIKAKSFEITALLQKFGGKLEAHLTMEDNVLYPKLFEHSNPEVRKTAQEFFDEMGDLKPIVSTWLEKWSHKEILEEQADSFIFETNNIFSALARRVEREDTILYPLVESSTA